MYYAYIIKSFKDGSYYKGHTYDLEKRIYYHNSGKSRYSKSHRPWKLHYFETFQTKNEAIKREVFFKSVGYKWLKENKII